MDTHKFGLIIILISVLFSLVLWGFENQLDALSKDSECCESEDCHVHREHSLTHFGIAIIVLTLSLGVYILFFEKSHKVIVEKFNESNRIQSEEERFNLILLGLNNDEKKVLRAIKEQDGITQHTLGIRTDLHKSKLSIIVGILENKALIKKEKKGKTNQLFLRVNLLNSKG